MALNVLSKGSLWCLSCNIKCSLYGELMFPEASVECAMCTGGEEDCFHLFFELPFTRAVWANQRTTRVDVTSDEALWRTLTGGQVQESSGGEKALRSAMGAMTAPE